MIRANGGVDGLCDGSVTLVNKSVDSNSAARVCTRPSFRAIGLAPTGGVNHGLTDRKPANITLRVHNCWINK